MSFQDRMDACMAGYLASQASCEVEKAIATAGFEDVTADWLRALALMCYANGAHEAYVAIREELLEPSGE